MIAISTSQATVNTQIQGSGSVETHLEVEVNGQKKSLDANQPGQYELKLEASPATESQNESAIEPSEPPEVKLPPDESELKSTESADLPQENQEEPHFNQLKWTTLIERIQQFIASLLSRLF